MRLNSIRLCSGGEQRAVLQTARSGIASLVDRGKYDLIVVLAVLQFMPARMARRVQMSYAIEVVRNIGVLCYPPLSADDICRKRP